MQAGTLYVEIITVISPRDEALNDALDELAEFAENNPWSGIGDAVQTILDRVRFDMEAK